MSIIFTLLLMISLIGLFVGLINPEMVLGKFTNNPSRKLVFKVFGFISLLSLILIGLFTPKSENIKYKNFSNDDYTFQDANAKEEIQCNNFNVSLVSNLESKNLVSNPDVLVFSINMNTDLRSCWDRLVKHATEEHIKRKTWMQIYYTTKKINSYNFYNKKLPKEIIAVLYANMATATFIKDPENYNSTREEQKVWCSYDCKK